MKRASHLDTLRHTSTSLPGSGRMRVTEISLPLLQALSIG
jgi:hypothetical protein